MAGSVDYVYPTIVPSYTRRSRRDRNPPFALLWHPVHLRGAFVHLADPVNATGIVEYALGGGRLASVDMGSYADVPYSAHGNLGMAFRNLHSRKC